MAFYQTEPMIVVIQVLKEPGFDDLDVVLVSVKPEASDCAYHNEKLAQEIEENPELGVEIAKNGATMCNACWFREDFSNYGSEDWLKTNGITPLNSCYIVLKGRMTSESTWTDWGTEHDSYFEVEEFCFSKVFRDHLD